MANDETIQTGLSRRGFLTAGGALVGASLLLGPGRGVETTPLARLASRVGSSLSLGYVRSSKGATPEEIDALLASGGAEVVSATSLKSGGATADGGMAQVRISGRGSSPTTKAATLDALVQPAGAKTDADLVPFYAWTMVNGAPTSSDVRFVVPYEQQPTVGFTLKSSSDGVAWTEHLAVLTGGGQRGLAKLDEGAYLVGFQPGMWSGTKVLPAVEGDVLASLRSLLVTVHGV